MKKAFYKKIGLILALAVMIFLIAPHGASASAFLPDWMDKASTIVGNLISSLFEVFLLPLAAGILALSGILLDKAIYFSLHTSYIFSLSPAINLGWTIVRDLANLFFIFILIFISLKTIVVGTGFGTNSALKNVVIAAILINFSLFITKAAIDVSNIFGNWMYTGVIKTVTVNNSSNASLSSLITDKMGLIKGWSTAGGAIISSDPTQSLTGRLLRLTVALIAIYIFVYAAVLFMARSIELLFLLVFAPVGFMGKILPQIEEYSKEWKKELINTAVFPLVFLIMLYISLQFINSINSFNSALVSAGISGNNVAVTQGSAFTIADYFKYFLVIFLLKATLSVSKKYSGELGDKFSGVAEGLGKLAVNMVGTYAAGGATMLMRAGGRGLGAALSAEKGKRLESFKKTSADNLPPILTGNGKLAQYIKTPSTALKDAKEGAINKLKSGTWDVRNIPTGSGTVGEQLTSLVGGSIGNKSIDLKGIDGKAIKAQQAEWTEEKKIEKANQAILRHLEKLASESNTLLSMGLSIKQLKERAESPTATAAEKAQYITGLKEFDERTGVKDSRTGIADETAKLGNKQIEKLDKKALKNEEVVRAMSQNQAEHIADIAENDEDKAKVWNSRLSDVTGLIKNNAKAEDLKKAVKSHSDEELRNLPPDMLIKEQLINPDAMDYDKFDKLIKSKNLTNATRNEMRRVRYKGINDAIASPASPTRIDEIEEELKKLEPAEIAKLPWDKKDPAGVSLYKILGDPEVLYRLDTKTLKKLYEELNAAERDEVKRTITGNAAIGSYRAPGSEVFDINPTAPLTPEAKKRVVQAAKFFVKDQIGQEF